jgi:uncharacterized protein (DUF1330 family)
MKTNNHLLKSFDDYVRRTVQGLHAQTKPKAYSINEVEILDKAALDAFAKAITPVVQEAGGKSLSLGGKVIARTGEAPKAVVIAEWDSLDKAEAYYKSTYSKFSPQRDKAWKVIRAFVVESTLSDGTSLAGSKAFIISGNEPINKEAQVAFGKVAIPAVRAKGGRPSGVNGGKIVPRTGEAPKSVTLVGWDSVEKAEAYYNSIANEAPPQTDEVYRLARVV